MKHATHPKILLRLKRAEGHLRSIIQMMEESRSCVELAQQLHAVERAIANAKRSLIHDHIEHCLSDTISDGSRGPTAGLDKAALAELQTLTKYL